MITVLTTTFNCGFYLRHAIRSIINQTYNNFEFLIIDDGSTDNTEEVVRQFNDSRLNYVKREHCGRAASLNYGLRNSSHEVIALMDADDISHPERIELQLKIYSGEENEVVFTRAAYFKDRKILFTGDLMFSEEIFKKKLALHGPYNNSTVLFNRNLILSNYGYDESLKVGEDHDLWLRLMNQIKIKQNDEMLYFIRLRDSSLSYFHFSNSKNVTYNILQKYYINLSDSFGITSPEEEIKLKGWREYFYGNRSKARTDWNKLKVRSRDLRMLIAYLFTFLPSNLFSYVKNKRFQLRVYYLFSRISNSDKVQKQFSKILRSL